MGHQIADGDGAVTALKFREVLRDQIVGGEAVLVIELHQGAGGGYDFGQRSDIENGVGRHGFAGWHERAFAVGFAIDDFAIVADEENRAGNFVFANRLMDGGIELGRSRETLPSSGWALRKQSGAAEREQEGELHSIIIPRSKQYASEPPRSDGGRGRHP